MSKRIVVPPPYEELDGTRPAQEFDPRLLRACNWLLDCLLDEENEGDPDEVVEKDQTS